MSLFKPELIVAVIIFAVLIRTNNKDNNKQSLSEIATMLGWYLLKFGLLFVHAIFIEDIPPSSSNVKVLI